MTTPNISKEQQASGIWAPTTAVIKAQYSFIKDQIFDPIKNNIKSDLAGRITASVVSAIPAAVLFTIHLTIFLLISPLILDVYLLSLLANKNDTENKHLIIEMQSLEENQESLSKPLESTTGLNRQEVVNELMKLATSSEIPHASQQQPQQPQLQLASSQPVKSEAAKEEEAQAAADAEAAARKAREALEARAKREVAEELAKLLAPLNEKSAQATEAAKEALEAQKLAVEAAMRAAEANKGNSASPKAPVVAEGGPEAPSAQPQAPLSSTAQPLREETGVANEQSLDKHYRYLRPTSYLSASMPQWDYARDSNMEKLNREDKKLETWDPEKAFEARKAFLERNKKPVDVIVKPLADSPQSEQS
ncbi:MAG TPA: hypothetical protein VLG76_03925 [Rhabdochlamydiaceae bacterium]|nr:hypothetical protein [Rhabdochlamydiaceae bacterium]